ncbi:replication protein A 70 kDa DNA-binding subunit D-like [Apium graveolens]|uniref:replication protein A 70 kDa DNA-binding subunit D-like n=1 Tax=Apium graveolens TaxID=4045 RepID=UPI003D7AC59C
MAPVIVHSLSSLDIYSRNLRIRVRVTRLWHTNNREGVFVGCNLILLDPRAFVRADIWNSLDNTIVKGQMYEITNFITTHASRILRLVRSALKIVFTPLTTVQTMYPNDLDRIFIERHNFEFVSLPQLAINLESYALDRTFAIDIIGVVADLQPRVNIETNFGALPLIRFNVTQGPDVSFKVDIWGALTESMTSLYEDGEEAPVIIVLSSAKVIMYKGVAIITNTPASEFYINPGVHEVFNFRHWLEGMGYDGADSD